MKGAICNVRCPEFSDPGYTELMKYPYFAKQTHRLAAVFLMALVCGPSLAHAQSQSYELVPINRAGQISTGLDEVAVYAAPVRRRNVGDETIFALATTAGGVRGSSRPDTTVWEMNAASVEPIVPRTVNVQPGAETVGLEAAPDGTSHPLLQVVGTSDPPTMRYIGISGEPAAERGLSGSGLSLGTVAEFACHRTDPTCALVYGSGAQLRTLRVSTGPLFIRSEFVTPFTTPVPDQWDITYDSRSAIISVHDLVGPVLRTSRLTPQVASQMDPLDILATNPNRVGPRIASARSPNNNFTLVVFQAGLNLAGTVLRDGAPVPISSIYAGGADMNQLLPQAYDVSPGPHGFRVVYFVRFNGELHLRVVGVAIDGAVEQPMDFRVGTTESPRNVRIAAAFDQEYSVITWIQGLRGNSQNRGYVYRPVARSTGPDGDGGDATTDEGGVIPVPPDVPESDAVENDVPTGPEEDGATALMDATDVRSSNSPPPTVGPRYTGGACQCTTTAHSTSKKPGILLAFALCAVASQSARRRRQR